MPRRALLLWGLLWGWTAAEGSAADGDCPDINGRPISPGLHYIPGPDTCTLCICEGGQPKWCKAVLCSPPQDCKSLFRQGNTCCEFICLDDALSARPDAGADPRGELGLRLTATAVAALLLLSAAVAAALRLRRRKAAGRQGGQPGDDPRALAGVGYISGSMSYLGGGRDDAAAHFAALWKPPGGHFPRGEAPPPYDEAVAQARAEAMRYPAAAEGDRSHLYVAGSHFSAGGVPGYHRSFPLGIAGATVGADGLVRLESVRRDDDRPGPQYRPADDGRSASPFYLADATGGRLGVGDAIADLRDRQVVVAGANRSRNFTARHSISSSACNNNFISTLKITSSLAPIVNRNRVSNDRERNNAQRNNFLYGPNSRSPGIESPIGGGSSTQPRNMPNNVLEMSRHRTIPRALGNLEDQMNEARNYIHFKQRPAPPKNFTGGGAPSARAEDAPSRRSGSGLSRLSADTNNPRLISAENAPTVASGGYPKDNNSRYAKESGVPKTPSKKMAAEPPPQIGEMAPGDSKSNPVRTLERHPLLPLPSDMTPCGCSYSSEGLGMMNDDQDDYHSECENCKSANGSRYYLDESEEGSELCETMTLHRKPLSEHGAEDLNQLPTSLTLPVKTKRNRCPTGSRDAWFSSMPGTSSSEDD